MQLPQPGSKVTRVVPQSGSKVTRVAPQSGSKVTRVVVPRSDRGYLAYIPLGGAVASDQSATHATTYNVLRFLQNCCVV